MIVDLSALPIHRAIVEFRSLLDSESLVSIPQVTIWLFEPKGR